jgi:hypothetical protein
LQCFFNSTTCGNTGQDIGVGAAAKSEKALCIKSVFLIVSPSGSQLPANAGIASDISTKFQVDDIAGIPCNP